MDHPTIRNIIFDLGGVIMNIQPQLTYRAFARLSGNSEEEIMNFYKNSSFFWEYESGRMSDADFLDHIKRSLGDLISDTSIAVAWNALLVEIPPAKIEMLEEARKKYFTCLLSNTNHIHSEYFENVFIEVSGGRDIYSFFDKVYYSYRMNCRKPDPVIFKIVLHENNLNPSETLLIDDSLENIETAKSLGIQTRLVLPNQSSFEIP